MLTLVVSCPTASGARIPDNEAAVFTMPNISPEYLAKHKHKHKDIHTNKETYTETDTERPGKA